MKNKKKRSRKGFSLIELVVTIAILAVLLIILTPRVLQYTERSRSQKDTSAMDEVVNAVQLALSDSNNYDEMLRYSCDNNFITYTDSSGKYGQKIEDEEYWAPDGWGRATTITFNPIKTMWGTVYKLEEAIVNDMTYGNGSTTGEIRTMIGSKIDDNQCLLKNASTNDGSTTAYLYNRIRQSVGETFTIDSQTYGNSSFTIFIKWNSVDGTLIPEVYGSFNGTNLYTGANASVGSGTKDYTNDELKLPVSSNPDGGTTDSNYYQSDLSGSGTFGGANPDYKQGGEDIDKLESMYDFGYYSTLHRAIEDVNNGTPGQNADVDRSLAVAGIYIDLENKPVVVLMSDYVTNKQIDIKKTMILKLSGFTITTSSGPIGICVHNGDFTIDGTRPGSTILHQVNNTNAIVKTICDPSTTNTATIKLLGGTYITESVGLNTQVFNITTTFAKLDIFDATLKASGEASEKISNVLIGSKQKSSISNSSLEVTTETCKLVESVKNIAAHLTISDSKIKAVGNEAATGFLDKAETNAHTVLLSNKFECESQNNTQCILIFSSAQINGCVLNGTAYQQTVRGIYITTQGNATITNCSIDAYAPVYRSWGIYNIGSTIIKNSTINAYANMSSDGTRYTAAAEGIRNDGAFSKMTVNNCTVYGGNCAIKTFGLLYLDGGTYTASATGAIIVDGDNHTQTDSSVAHIKNAHLRIVPMPSDYSISMNVAYAGIYIGGSSNIAPIKAYVDNCYIYGTGAALWMSKFENASNNKLYISNSRISGNTRLRIADNSHMIYIGAGNNFTGSTADIKNCISKTDEVYAWN